MIGLARTLQLEGAKYGIRVNCIVPAAATRMTEDIFPEDAFAAFDPESVAAAALFLVSADAPANAILGAAAGVYQGAWTTMNKGVLLPPDERTPEGVAAAWERISDRAGDGVVAHGMEQAQRAIRLIQEG